MVYSFYHKFLGLLGLLHLLVPLPLSFISAFLGLLRLLVPLLPARRAELQPASDHHPGQVQQLPLHHRAAGRQVAQDAQVGRRGRQAAARRCAHRQGQARHLRVRHGPSSVRDVVSRWGVQDTVRFLGQMQGESLIRCVVRQLTL